MADEIRETVAYKCWERYYNTFYVKSNMDSVLKENRNFYEGRQYSENTANDMPKPTFNITREYAEKVTAKVLENKPYVSFIADIDSENLQTIDNFYEYQMNEIDDDEITARVCKRGFIDGIGIAITSFDEDTLGIESLFKGFIKRQVIPFEQTFWANPYCEDPQDQEYWGYYYPMSIGSVKKLIEGDEKRVKEISKLIVPDSVQNLSTVDLNRVSSDIDDNVVNVYARLFKINGEVFFELCTKWADLYEYPHAINPDINEKIAKELKEKLEKELKDGIENDDKKITDYKFDNEKYVLFTKAKKNNHSEYNKGKSKFHRYPVSVFRPYPIDGSILGTSGVSLIIANQKIVNYIFLLITLIMQSHAMPKILAKEGALQGQEYDNSPNQILTDYSSVTSGVQWGITRLSSGDAVNSNLITIGDTVIKLTRNINGFDDLVSNFTSDTSGYAYQQMVQQENLTLEQPQKRLWKYIKDNARTDMLYFKHYVPQAKFYKRMSDQEFDMQENYRMMSQSLINSGQVEGYDRSTVLPKTRKIQVKDVTNEMFDAEFNVSIEVEQGIASSQLSESQHYQQVFQYIASGNLDADKIKMMIENDPAFSAKTRQRIKYSLEALENSQLQIKNQEIEQLQGMIQNLIQNLKTSNQNIQYLKMRDDSREKALQDNIKQNKAFFESYVNSQEGNNTMSESEVKSNNAKGIEGGHFNK